MGAKVNVGVIIPTRGDRQQLLDNSLRMLKAQTLQPSIVNIQDFAPADEEKDITKRYRLGYEALRGKGLDIIACWEDDDWYSPQYLETIVKEWELHGRPDLFGTIYTIYYSLRQPGYFTYIHSERSSMMSTLIRPDLTFDWCLDSQPYTDMHLWCTLVQDFKKLSGILFRPQKHICIGIKHGIGMCGGGFHVDKLKNFTPQKKGGDGVEDLDMSILKGWIDPESFEFYKQLSQSIRA